MGYTMRMPARGAGHNVTVPRIAAPTVAENRELRRDALLAAAATLMQRGGSFTVAEVAQKVGLSRSAVYEYYSSAAELSADVMVDELSAWSEAMSLIAGDGPSPRDRVHAWLQAVLDYVADGRHALLRSAADVEVPVARRDQLHDLHESVVAPLVDALADAGCPDPYRVARYVWGVVEVAIARIENGEVSAADEAPALFAFVDAALSDVLGR